MLVAPAIAPRKLFRTKNLQICARADALSQNAFLQPLVTSASDRRRHDQSTPTVKEEERESRSQLW
jgi:hypothetical protein